MVLYNDKSNDVQNELKETNKRNTAALGAVVSFIFPGIGLFFSKKQMMVGVAMFIGVVIIDIILGLIGSLGFICLLPFVCWLMMPLFNLLAAVYTYQVISTEE